MFYKTNYAARLYNSTQLKGLLGKILLFLKTNFKIAKKIPLINALYSKFSNIID